MKKKLFFILVAMMVVPIVSRANLISYSGFENTQVQANAEVGKWYGDYATTVGSEQGIKPLEGSQMLRFDGTSPDPQLPSGNGCDIYQYVDLRTSENFSSISSGNVALYASAYFNRINTPGTDTRFDLFLYAFSNATLPTYIDSGYTTKVFTTIYTDSDTTTWEQLLNSMVLPGNTTYVAFRIRAYEDISPDLYWPEFNGNYADCMYLDFTEAPEIPAAHAPEPSTILLLGSGLTGLGFLRRKLGKA